MVGVTKHGIDKLCRIVYTICERVGSFRIIPRFEVRMATTRGAGLVVYYATVVARRIRRMAKKVRLTPEQAAEKWGRRTTQATGDMSAGIDRVTVSPGKLAAAKKTKWVQKMSDPAIQDKWERRTAAVDLEAWKTKARDVGVGRVAAGVAAANGKQQAFYEQLFPYQDRLLGEVDAMNDLTLEDSIARMTAWVRGMNQFKRT